MVCVLYTYNLTSISIINTIYLLVYFVYINLLYYFLIFAFTYIHNNIICVPAAVFLRYTYTRVYILTTLNIHCIFIFHIVCIVLETVSPFCVFFFLTKYNIWITTALFEIYRVKLSFWSENLDKVFPKFS